jgi:hypothetical protein
MTIPTEPIGSTPQPRGLSPLCGDTSTTRCTAMTAEQPGV